MAKKTAKSAGTFENGLLITDSVTITEKAMIGVSKSGQNGDGEHSAQIHLITGSSVFVFFPCGTSGTEEDRQAESKAARDSFVEEVITKLVVA